MACHSTNTDYTSVHGVANRTDIPTTTLSTAGLPVATSLNDPDSNMPPKVSLEYAADINLLPARPEARSPLREHGV